MDFNKNYMCLIKNEHTLNILKDVEIFPIKHHTPKYSI